MPIRRASRHHRAAAAPFSVDARRLRCSTASHRSLRQSRLSSARSKAKLAIEIEIKDDTSSSARRRGLRNKPVPPPRWPEQDIKDMLYYGWLWKKGSSFHTWKQRFFLLNGCALSYFTKPCMITSDRFGTHCLDLPVQGGLRVASAEMTDRTEFGIKIVSTRGRELFLQAGDETARMQWLCAFHEAIQQQQRQQDGEGNRSLSARPPSALENMSSKIVEPSNSESTLSISNENEIEWRGWIGVTTRASASAKSLKKRFVQLANGQLVVLTTERVWRAQDVTLDTLSVARWIGHENGLHVQVAPHKSLFIEATSKQACEDFREALLHSL